MGGTADAEHKSAAMPTRRPRGVDGWLGSRVPPVSWSFRMGASLFGWLRYGSC